MNSANQGHIARSPLNIDCCWFTYLLIMMIALNPYLVVVVSSAVYIQESFKFIGLTLKLININSF